jgi:FkbM family methyltransferase
MKKIDKNIYFNIEEDLLWRKDDEDLQTYNILKNETELLEIVKPYLKDNKVIVQAGGNCGMQIVKFADYFDMVYTFEPDPVNFHCLVNNLHYNNVVKLQCCVGDSHKMVSMNNLEGATGGFYVNQNFGNIPTMMIDDLNLYHCNFIQLDVEGYQMHALRGAIYTIQRFKPVISIEFDWVDRYEYTKNDLINFFHNIRYKKVESYTSDHIYVFDE